MKLLKGLLACAVHSAVVFLIGKWSRVSGVDLAIAPLIAGAAIMGGASLGSALINKFGGGEDIEQVPLETPEQKAARAALLSFANTGTWGDFTAGAQVPLGYGDYRMTDQEQLGQTALTKLLNAGTPDLYSKGNKALDAYLNTNPMDVSAQFDPFRDQVNRQISESERALKRGAGFAGNLYSTDTIRNLGDIRARGNETLTSQLANLTNESLNRRLQAIPLAYQAAESEQNSALQRIDASQKYGDLARSLNDASIKARDAELLRRRSELQLPIQALTSVAGGNTQFGVPSVSSPSPYADLLNMVGKIGGQYVGNQLFMSQYKSNFPGSTPPPSNGMMGGGGLNLSY